MSVSIGTRIGPYEIVWELGSGGMGEVYRARDARLDRDLAIKILPEFFASDPERLARFQREAQVLASLNHPNICALYHIGDAPHPQSLIPNPDKIQYLVMELVEGPTLAEVFPILGGGTNAALRQQYDVASDGRFLLTLLVDDAGTSPITLLMNWNPQRE